MDKNEDALPMLSTKAWANTLERARADVIAGRTIEIDIDALSDEIDADAEAMERQQQKPRAPSPA